MKRVNIIAFASLIFSLFITLCSAGKTDKPIRKSSPDLIQKFVKPGKPILSESFDKKELGKAWVANKGDWKIKDGVLVGSEKAEDNHPAVLSYMKPNKDSITRFSFKMNKAKMLTLSFNHAKGHLFRVTLTPAGMAVQLDPDKKDPKSKPRRLAEAKGKITPNEWHTLVVAIKGNKVVAQTDTGLSASASDPALDIIKTGYRFVMLGESLELDKIEICEVRP